MLGATRKHGWLKSQPFEHTRAKLAVVGLSFVVLFFVFGVAIMDSGNSCMDHAELGLNLTWWTGVNCVAAFLLVLLAVYVLKAIRIAWFIGLFFVPWHVIGFILFTTSQSSCITSVNSVGIAAVCIFVADVILIVAALGMYLSVRFKNHHSPDAGPPTAPWKRMTAYTMLAVGVFSVVGVGIGSSYLNDSCLTPDPTGVNLAQWILTISTVTFVFFLIVTVLSVVFHLQKMCCGNNYCGSELEKMALVDHVSALLTAIWAVFLIVWVPLGIFLVVSTQASCITTTSSDHTSLTVGFVLSMFLPLIAIHSVDHHTERILDFESLD